MEAILGLMVAFLVGWAFMWAIQQAINPHCPECGGAVPNGVTKCKHCGTSFGGPITTPWRLQIKQASQATHVRPSLLIGAVVALTLLVFALMAAMS